MVYAAVATYVDWIGVGPWNDILTCVGALCRTIVWLATQTALDFFLGVHGIAYQILFADVLDWFAIGMLACLGQPLSGSFQIWYYH